MALEFQKKRVEEYLILFLQRSLLVRAQGLVSPLAILLLSKIIKASLVVPLLLKREPDLRLSSPYEITCGYPVILVVLEIA